MVLPSHHVNNAFAEADADSFSYLLPGSPCFAERGALELLVLITKKNECQSENLGHSEGKKLGLW